MIFCDIDLQAHRDRLVPACERAGLAPLFPPGGEARMALAHDLVARGVQARVVCVDTRRLDAAFCGEDGEFHTVVTSGPGFVRPLRVVDAARSRVASRPPFTPTEFVFQALLPAPEMPRNG